MLALTILDCNRCGECCRHGGACMLRGKSWSQKKMPLEFEGVCELLAEDGECSVMRAVIAQGTPEYLKKYVGVKGICDFPHLRKQHLSLAQVV